MPPKTIAERDLRLLLAHLNREMPHADHAWEGWRITRIGGAANNLLYRADGEAGALAVKWTTRDARDRAGREFDALSLLAEEAPGVAPLPLLLDRETYRQPVIVQSWLEGEPQTEPPQDDEGWRGMMTYLAQVHAIRPVGELRQTVLYADSAATALANVHAQLDLLPADHRPVDLLALVRVASTTDWPAWSLPRVTICRGDPNIRNFMRDGERWSSVDWEYSGLCDPAFQVADLLVHPAYEALDGERRAWIVQLYTSLQEDAFLPLRVAVYYRLMLVWWAVRLQRYLYDFPRNLDRRLAEPAPDWEEQARGRYRSYLTQAASALAATGEPW